MNIARSAAIVGGTTLVSRVLGFIRDMMIAAVVGSGPIADAFFVAFRLPNMFRSIFAEGAFNAAFVPLFARRLAGEGEDAARRFAEDSMAVLLTVLFVLTIAAQIAMPWLIWILAPGFGDDPQKQSWAIQFARISFPYLVFITMTALQTAVLNSLGRFFPGAAAPVMLNVVLIVTLTLIAPLTENPGLALSWGVAVAGVVQFVWVTTACMRAGMRLRLRFPRVTPAVKRLVRLGIPGVIAGGIGQINLTVGTMIASMQAGAVSWLYYADRIYQLPLGVIGIAIGVVLLPDLARRLRTGDDSGANWSQNRAIEFSMLLTLPAALALAIIPYPIIKVLFERGAFDMADTQATALALLVYAAGLPAFVLNKVFAPAFFARENTKTPLQFATISIVVNIVTSLVLFQVWGFAGIAAGTTIAAWTNTSLLGLRLHKQGLFIADERLKKTLPLLLMAAVGMGGILWFGASFLTPYFASHAVVGVIALAGLVLGGLTIYVILCELTGAARLADIRRAFTRRV